MIRVETEPGAVVFSVKIVPGASRTRLLGEWENGVRIAVASPPEKGRANRELVRFLADLVGVRPQAVAVVAGHTSPRKRVRIEGIAEPELLTALG